MQCILHIGLHKTGSSSIQSSLRGYDDGKSVYATLSKNNNHSVVLHTVFSEDYLNYKFWKDLGLPDEKVTEIRKNFRASVEKLISLNKGKNVIFSGEDMAFLPPSGAKALIDFMKSHFDDVKVIAYVRHPADFAASAFQEQVKGGLSHIDEISPPDYRNKIGIYLDLLGRENITLKEFSPESLLDGDVVKDFCAVANLNYEHVNPSYKNVSWNAELTKLLYRFNRTSPLTGGEIAVMTWYNKFKRILQTIFQHGSHVPKALFESVADYSDQAWLKTEFDIDFSPRDSAPASRQDLLEWLDDIPAQTIHELEAFLDLNGAAATGKELPWLLNRLFCMVVQGYQLAAENRKLIPPGLIESDANVLGTVAMKYEDNTAITKFEALSLMTLAVKARPDEAFKEKLRQWIS